MGPDKSCDEIENFEDAPGEQSTDSDSEPQANAGAEAPQEAQSIPVPTIQLPSVPEPVAQTPGTVTSTPISSRTSTSSWDGAVDTTSLISDPEAHNHPQKVPIFRRLTNTFTSQKSNVQGPLIGRSYGPRVEQRIRSIDEYPPGYGRLAAIEGCDPNFMIYRKFSWLHNRILLHYQDELALLEEKLEWLDENDFLQDPYFVMDRRRDEKRPDSQRGELIKRIDEKLAQYHALLLRLQQVDSIKRPTERNQSSLWHLLTTTRSQVTQETHWIHMGPDLAAVAHDQEYGYFNMFVEGTLKRISEKATKALFRSKEQKITSGSIPTITLLSPRRLDFLLRTILTIVAAALLLLPVFILFNIQPTNAAEVKTKGTKEILTIFGFTLIFSMAVSILTKAKRQEVFTATAAYCAVLVVFLGNTSNLLTSGGK